MADEQLGIGLAMVNAFPTRWTFATGKQNLANSIARRLQTERGTLDYAPDEGLDVRELLSEGLSQASLSAWTTAIARECERDPRVRSASVTITPDETNEALTIAIELDSTVGGVALVLNVNALTVALLEAA